jgi:hypothetical protein
VTSARVAAAQARRELAFLEVCEQYQLRLEEAKDALRAAKESGSQDAVTAARGEQRTIAREVHEFRAWARTTGRPREGVPGRDATIRVGG